MCSYVISIRDAILPQENDAHYICIDFDFMNNVKRNYGTIAVFPATGSDKIPQFNQIHTFELTLIHRTTVSLASFHVVLRGYCWKLNSH